MITATKNKNLELLILWQVYFVVVFMFTAVIFERTKH